jgi:inhibitor of KinA sporulation pathway (predicted exonuclease)
MKNFNIANVIDIELTCYPNGIFPAGEVPEPIEIGLCELDLETLEIRKSMSFPIVPTRSSVSPFCTELTGWTYPVLKKRGFTFAKVCELLTKYGAANRLVVSDSDNEVSTIAEHCLFHGVQNPFGPSQLNVATLFSILTMQKQNLSLEAMLQHLGMSFEGTPHRGEIDANNIARLLIKLLQESRTAIAPLCIGKDPAAS